MLKLSNNLKNLLFVERNQVKNNLIKQLCNLDKNTPLLIHTDIMKLGILDGELDERKFPAKWWETILEASENRQVIIPTFNYDFTKNGIFDIKKSLGQVGLLSKYCGIYHSENRTLTPIFNCCVFNANIDRSPSNNAFGKSSIFHYLFKNNGVLLFLGTDMRSNTFLHYVEEILNIGYRYLKLFKGIIINDSEKIKIDFLYRVSPMVNNAVVYDYNKVTNDLIKDGLLKFFHIGLSTGLLIKAKDYFYFVEKRINEDELYLLTNNSRNLINDLYKKYDRPLTFEKFEGS